MAYSASFIAEAFLEIAKRNGKSLTQLALQKLVYIAHGYYLANYDKPLVARNTNPFLAITREPTFIALQHGPVSTELLDKYNGYGTSAISSGLDQSVLSQLDDNANKLLEKVWANYGQFSAGQLVNLTHRPGTPWAMVYRRGIGRSRSIPNAVTKKYYSELIANQATSGVNGPSG